jgi:hypothetical protein
MPSVDGDRAVATVISVLRDEFPAETGESIAGQVCQTYAAFDGARICDLIPIFVLRRVRADLRQAQQRPHSLARDHPPAILVGRIHR